MGSLCSKASSDNFAGQGRPVGSTPAPAGTASVPKTVKAGAPKVGGPPRTLGGGASAGQAGGAADDARRKAAAAAEVCLLCSPTLCRSTTLLRYLVTLALPLHLRSFLGPSSTWPLQTIANHLAGPRASVQTHRQARREARSAEEDVEKRGATGGQQRRAARTRPRRLGVGAAA